MRIFFIYFLVVWGAVVLAWADPGTVRAAENAWREALELERQMAREQAAWREERAWLERQQKQLEEEANREEQALVVEREALAAMRAEDSASAGLLEEKAAADQAWREHLKAEAEALEALLADLPMISPELSTRLARARTTLPEEAELPETLPLLRTVLAGLQELDRWDGTIQRRTEEIVRDGQTYQAEVLWFGFSQAFYRLPDGSAGAGAWGTDRGRWDALDQAGARAVEEALAAFDQPVTARPVLLPLQPVKEAR